MWSVVDGSSGTTGNGYGIPVDGDGLGRCQESNHMSNLPGVDDPAGGNSLGHPFLRLGFGDSLPLRCLGNDAFGPLRTG